MQDKCRSLLEELGYLVIAPDEVEEFAGDLELAFGTRFRIDWLELAQSFFPRRGA